MDESPHLVRAAVEQRMAELSIDTQGALAEAAGVDRDTVGNVLDGKTKPHQGTRAKLARALQWPADWLDYVRRGEPVPETTTARIAGAGAVGSTSIDFREELIRHSMTEDGSVRDMLTGEPIDPDDATVIHVTPIGKGGEQDSSNMLLVSPETARRFRETRYTPSSGPELLVDARSGGVTYPRGRAASHQAYTDLFAYGTKFATAASEAGLVPFVGLGAGDNRPSGVVIRNGEEIGYVQIKVARGPVDTQTWRDWADQLQARRLQVSVHAGDHIAVVGWFVGDHIEEWIEPQAHSLKDLHDVYGIDVAVGDEQLQSVLQEIARRASTARSGSA